MPSKVNVKVNNVTHTTKTARSGAVLNYVKLTGFNATDNKGFSKEFFATKKDGSATKSAETADTLNQDDWVEITMDDTSYKNVQSIRPIQAPADAGSVPSQASQPVRNTGGGGSDRMSKAEWAEKDAKKEISINRSSALKQAVVLAASNSKGGTKANVDSIEKLTKRFFDYLMTGDFDGKAEELSKISETPALKTPAVTPDVVDPSNDDDDIPF